MVQEMSKKQTKFPARPKPPSAKEMVKDLSDGGPNDIAFTLFRTVKSDLTPSSETANLMMESFISQEDMLGSPLPTSESSTSEVEFVKPNTDIDTLYQQAVQFLDVSENLKDAPETLKSKCKELQGLDEELKESIESLKEQSYRLLNSTCDNKDEIKT